ncbi:hypothetical protein BGZ96_007291 [Linnemannia gamsii]|uniref:Uncharacterized protein n=1 Tax=Linnemannia gamsii TaxID=64522 RepID=A0ABQ7K1E9_9FUNG|nr:hypothetical protein BGZ96_007291 [Linnemannia gamsii]
MPYIRSDSGAMPTGFGDDDPTIGMGFSIVITICSLAGLLFCFRRASALIPRNLTIPLQMFGGGGGQSNRSSATRGPIALSDDDMEGATRIDWDELDAQFEDLNGNGGEELQAAGGSGRLLKPVTRQARYLDDDGDEDGSQDDGEPYRMTAGGEDENAAPFADDDDEELEAGTEVPGKGAKKDQLFKLGTDESEQEI